MKRLILMVLALITLTPAMASADVINDAAICYHSVTKSPLELSEYKISEQELEEDIKYFAENGYTTLKPSEMYYSDCTDAVVLTFDDGYEDFYSVVYPLLKKYNAKAAVYVISSRIDKEGYLKSWQLKEIDRSGLVEIGNHTHIIHMYPYRRSDYESNMTLVNDFIEDVKECNARLYGILGHGVESLAYPSGQYTECMDSIIRTNLGYTTTFSTDYGIIVNRADIGNAMKRIYHEHGISTLELVQRINCFK